MHRERARTIEPELVAGAREQRKKRVAVPGGAVAEVRSLRQRAGEPRELASCEQQPFVFVVPGRDARERRDDAGRAVTPLHADLAARGHQAVLRHIGRPVREPVLLDGIAANRGGSSSMQLVVGVERQREHAAGEPVSGAGELVDVSVEPLRPEVRLRIPLTAQPRGALAPELEPPRLTAELVHGAGGEHRAGAAPHQLAPLVAAVRADQRLEPIGVLRRRRQPLQHEPDPRLAHPEAPLVIVVGPVGLVQPLERRDVVAAQLHQAASLQRTERLDDARSAEVDRAEAALVVTRALAVDRVSRPTVVECIFSVGDNGADRGTNANCIPLIGDQRLVNGGIEEHRQGYAASDRRPSSDAIGCIASTTFAMC